MGLATRHLLAGDLDVEPPKKKAPIPATSLSLGKLRDEGWLADKVERYSAIPVPRRFDWCGFGDIIAVNEQLGVLVVQTTSGTQVSHHLRKFEEEPEITAAIVKCLRAGVHVEVHGWAVRGAYKRRKLRTCRVVEARLGAAGMIEWEEKGDG